MFALGDHVVYGIHGVCVVASTEERIVDRQKVTYLVLEPVQQSSSRYLVPTHNEVAMKKLSPLLTAAQLDALLMSPEVREDAWISDENQRKQYYRELISSGDRLALLRMIRSLHSHKDAQMAAGRKFHLCDENFLRDAQRLLSGEFSLILNIPQEQVAGYVLAKLNEE